MNNSNCADYGVQGCGCGGYGCGSYGGGSTQNPWVWILIIVLILFGGFGGSSCY